MLENINFHDFAESMMKILELKDKYTRGHSSRVADYTSMIAKEMNFTTEEVKFFHIAAHLHDIGKVIISDSIINKKGKLTEEEFEKIKKHPVTGYEILNKVKGLKEMAQIIRGHHERWDGEGYPDKLKGENILIGSRIITVADAFDAMTSTRSYRTALGIQKSLEILEKNKWKQFDGEIVDIFIKIIKENGRKLCVLQ